VDERPNLNGLQALIGVLGETNIASAYAVAEP